MSPRFPALIVLSSLALLMILSGVAGAQLAPTTGFLAQVSNDYRVLPNVTYHVANGHENKLDLYLPRNAAGPTPLLVYIHGGGWIGGTKEASILRVLPYLEMGWAVANVEYRLGAVSLAPAAVEDCLCALHWLKRNAEDYNIDTSRIVTTGNSAGGHLALTTALVPASAGLDLECATREPLGVAAVVNWYGITDVGDMLAGQENERSYAVRWLGSLPDNYVVASRVSPLTYVREGLPPILTIHGDADPTVPYQQAVTMHEMLSEAGVANELHTVPGGRHGGFNREQTIAIFETIDRFLRQHELGTGGSTSQGQ
jgi:acetyl esterase/lipase